MSLEVGCESGDGGSVFARGGEQHAAPLEVDEKRNVCLSAPGSGFIDADLGDRGMIGFGTRSIHIVGDDTPDQGVVFANKAGCREDRHGLGQHQDQRLKQQREATAGPGPGNRDPVNAALRTVDAGRAGVEESLMLKEVQVPPRQGIGVVCFTVGCLANRTRKDAAARKIEMDVQTPGCLIESAVIDHPWRHQPQGCLKQFVLIHAHAIIAQRRNPS